MRFSKSAVAVFVVAGVLLPAGASAAPLPLDPIEVEASTQLGEGKPHVSPDGTQLIAFRTLKPAGFTSVLIERSNGGPFSEQIDLVQSNNVQSPSVSFTPDGGIYTISGIATSGALAQESIRAPGGDFTPPSTVANCNRFVDSAAGPGGEIALVCSHNEAAVPPNSYWLGTAPALGPVPVIEQLNPSVYDSFIQPRVDWGADGTLAVVASYWTTVAQPPPANQTRRVRATIRNAAQGVNHTIDFPNVTQPAELNTSGPVVLGDGSVAFGTGGTSGAQIQIRPPGAATAFAATLLPGEAATEPRVDEIGNLHVMSADQGPPRQYWANVRPPGGSFAGPVPIPLAGEGDPYIPFDGFVAAPDGTEYAVIRAADGIYATSREPGEASFDVPRLLGTGDSTNNPGVAVTADSDLLASWPIESAPGDFRLFVGGLDKTPPEVLVGAFPTSGTSGTSLDFAASATDQMGLRSTGWDFGGGNTVPGDTASNTFGPGDHPVSFKAVDRAGNETVIQRTIRVPGDPAGALKMKVVTPNKLKFRKLARRGVKVRVSANRALRLKVRIGTSRRKVIRKPLAAREVRTAKDRHILRIKPKRKRLGKPRKLKLFVRVTGTAAEGDSITRLKRIRVRR